MTVDIITTTYQNYDKLKICIPSVLENTKHVDYKWFLQANDPNQEMKDTIRDSLFVDDIMFTDRVEVIYESSNEGSFSSNNNEVAAMGNSEYILFLNDDMEVLNNLWLHSMVNMLDSDQKLGAVGALLLYPNRLIQHCGVFFSKQTNNLPFHLHYRKDVNKVGKFISVPRYYQAVTAACMLVRRKDFEALGGFSTDFYYGFEDVSLCLDITRKLGKKIVYCPGAVLTHHEGISGSFKKHPKLQENIAAFRKNCSGKYYDDLDFYMNDPNFMLYKNK